MSSYQASTVSVSLPWFLLNDFLKLFHLRTKAITQDKLENSVKLRL